MKTVTAAELALMLAAPCPPRVLDILPVESFNRVHLPQAENIPASRLTELAFDRLGRDETIVVYSADVAGQATPKAVSQLVRLGYRHVYGLEGGIAEWHREGYELVGTDARLSLRR